MSSSQARLQEETTFKVMRILRENPDTTQRELAGRLGISVGAVNYCLRALMEKGLVKMKNFSNAKNKFGYIYILTPRGISQKATLTHEFVRRKLEEFRSIKVEIKSLRVEVERSFINQAQGK